MSAVELHGVTRTHGRDLRRAAGTPAVRSLTFAADEGRWLSLVGPSGSGKTTTLRLIAGLDEPDTGTIAIHGRPMAGVPPPERGVGLVFQDHPLFPHLSVGRNLALPLELHRGGPAEIRRRVGEVAEWLGIASLLDRGPDTLSGGERQRVGLGAALVLRPRVLLLDEPFAQLDAPLRFGLRAVLRRHQRHLGLTVVHVTHDQAEALALADTLAVLRLGELQQIGSPLDVYRRPANPFVAAFLGSPGMNLFPGAWEDTAAGPCFRPVSGGVWTGFPGDHEARRVRSGCLGFRPEHVRLGEPQPGEPASFAWRGVIDHLEQLGHETLVRLVEEGTVVIARVPGTARLPVGGTVDARVAWSEVLGFPVVR